METLPTTESSAPHGETGRFPAMGGERALRKSRTGLLALGISFIVSSWFCVILAIRTDSTVGNDGLLYVDQSVLDLGELRQGVTKRAKFTLENRGDRTIFVHSVRASCGCTSHDLSDPRIEPGKSSTLELAVSTVGMRGAVASTATVLYFDEVDRDLKQLDVRIVARVEPDLNVSPEELRFEFGVSETLSVRITPHRVTTFEVRGMTCTHRAFSASRSETVDETSLSIEVSFDSEKLLDPKANAELIIETDCPGQPLLRIPLVVRESRL